ncbi:MAG TPA: DUF58 domain-containing protein [Polyangia bacterium]
MAADTDAPSTRAPALDPAALATLANLAVRARVIVEGAFSGMHHNLHAGTSMEFTEHKEYAPGDEIRRIDWKAAGRTGRYYVKRFEDETEMRTFLLVDASASMGYGRAGVSKLTYAGWLAGAFAYLLGQQGDPSGLLIFDADSRSYLPPSTRGGQVREIFRLLEAAAPGGTTGTDRILSHVGELIDKRSLVLVFTDLLDAEPVPAEGAPERRAAPGDKALGPVAERLANLAARGHDVVVFHVLDPDEIELPFDDLMHFEGVEPGDVRTLLAEANDLRDAFRSESAAFRERWRRACLETRIEYRLVTTKDAPADILRAFLSGRRGGRR